MAGAIAHRIERRVSQAMQRRNQESEEMFFKKIFESAPDAIVVTDREGRIVRVNSQAGRMFGYGPDELHGQNVEVLVPKWLRSVSMVGEAKPRPRQMRSFGTEAEFYGMRRDGSEFPADIVLGSAGTDRSRLSVAIIRDRTERKKAEEHLRESEENLRLLVEGAQDYAIFRLDSDGCVASWNAGAKGLMGFRAEEIIGEDHSRLYTLEDIQHGKPGEQLKAAAAQGRFEDEGWRVRKDGSQFCANVIITALLDNAGRLRGFTNVTRDITDRKRVEDALVLEITNVLVSQLDIRELLTAIAAILRRVKPYEHANLSLNDSETTQLRVLSLDCPYAEDPIHQGALLPLDGSPAGLAFSTGKPLLLNHIDTSRFSPEIVGRLAKADVRSGCFLPLVSRNRVLGTLTVC
jgi:PAS domain S-box-containing protein